jgi:16S rRNA (guanine527-N7)-methyltransferase
MNPEILSQLYKTLSWSPQAIQQEQFTQLYSEILRGNRQFNLTRITDEEAFWEKHIWDSLSGLSPWLSRENPSEISGEVFGKMSQLQPQRGIDIGTGGGFPGIVAAIVLPQTQITLLDSTRKKITFLQEVIQTLKLNTVKMIVDRVETLGHDRQHRSQYDLALIRAVGTPAVCAEYALPLLKLGGTAVLYRGQWTGEEEKHLSQVAQQLGGELKAVQAWTTPLTGGIRHCVYLNKVGPTPNAYPRAIGVPSQTPL